MWGRRNEFAEIISALFAIVIFFLIGGVLIKSVGEFGISGSLTTIISLAIIIGFILIIIKLIKSIENLF